MIRAYVHTQEKCIYKQILLQNQNRFFSFLLCFLTRQLTHIFFPSPSRACHSTQRQRAGSSFPERVPAGHGVKPNRGILLRTGPSFLAELHIQVQGYRSRGPKTSLTP